MFRRAKRPRVRREAQRRLTKVGLLSVGLVSFIVAVLTAAMIFLAGLVLWRYGVGTGVVERAEEIVANFTADGTFALDGPTLFAAWLAVSAMWAAALTVLGILLGVIFNFACFVTGGIRLKFRWYAPARLEAASRDAAEADRDTEVAGQQRLALDAVEAPAAADLARSRPGSGRPVDAAPEPHRGDGNGSGNGHREPAGERARDERVHVA